MTRSVILVSMQAWTVADIEARLAELGGGAADPEDPRERARQRILDVATEHFVRFGYRRANIGEIARDAGLGKGTLYLYFDGKRTLLVACVAREKMQLLPEIEAVLALPEPERLEAFLRAAFRFALGAPLSAKLVRGDRELALLMDELRQSESRPGALDSDLHRGVAFFESLVAPLTPEATEAERHTLASVLAAVSSLPAHLVEPERRMGLDVDRFVSHYAAVLARGVAAVGGS